MAQIGHAMELNKEHRLKTWPDYFQPLLDSVKYFEIRQNDRNFQVGDRLILHEYDPNADRGSRYTGRSLERTISYMTDFAQQDGWVVLGFDADAALRQRFVDLQKASGLVIEKAGDMNWAESMLKMAEANAALRTRLEAVEQVRDEYYASLGETLESEDDLRQRLAQMEQKLQDKTNATAQWLDNELLHKANAELHRKVKDLHRQLDEAQARVTSLEDQVKAYEGGALHDQLVAQQMLIAEQADRVQELEQTTLADAPHAHCQEVDTELILARQTIRDLQATLAMAQERIEQLKEVLQSLYDVQNGPPLFKYEKEWNAAMIQAKQALTPAREQSIPLDSRGKP